MAAAALMAHTALALSPAAVATFDRAAAASSNVTTCMLRFDGVGVRRRPPKHTPECLLRCPAVSYLCGVRRSQNRFEQAREPSLRSYAPI